MGGQDRWIVGMHFGIHNKGNKKQKAGILFTSNIIDQIRKFLHDQGYFSPLNINTIGAGESYFDLQPEGRFVTRNYKDLDQPRQILGINPISQQNC